MNNNDDDTLRRLDSLLAKALAGTSDSKELPTAEETLAYMEGRATPIVIEKIVSALASDEQYRNIYESIQSQLMEGLTSNVAVASEAIGSLDTRVENALLEINPSTSPAVDQRLDGLVRVTFIDSESTDTVPTSEETLEYILGTDNSNVVTRVQTALAESDLYRSVFSYAINDLSVNQQRPQSLDSNDQALGIAVESALHDIHSSSTSWSNQSKVWLALAATLAITSVFLIQENLTGNYEARAVRNVAPGELSRTRDVTSVPEATDSVAVKAISQSIYYSPDQDKWLFDSSLAPNRPIVDSMQIELSDLEGTVTTRVSFPMLESIGRSKVDLWIVAWPNGLQTNPNPFRLLRVESIRAGGNVKLKEPDPTLGAGILMVGRKVVSSVVWIESE